MAAPKFVEPRLDTPTPRTSSGLGTRGLPDAVLSEHVRRLAVCAAVGAGLWAYGLVMDSMIRPLSVGTAVSYSSIVVEILAIIVYDNNWFCVHSVRKGLAAINLLKNSIR